MIDFSDIQTKSPYFKYVLATLGQNTQSRDKIFLEVLNLFNGQPIRILEVGSMTTIDGRWGNGNSTMFWLMYLAKYGGELITTNINPQHLEDCKKVTSTFEPAVNAHYLLERGEKILEKDNAFDLVYLDGAHEAREMLIQYQLCNPDSYVLCDDFTNKGTEVRNLGLFHKLYVFEAGHQMALFHKRKITTNVVTNILRKNGDYEMAWEEFLSK
jgi:predicted O-methyltransferase YrrM